VESETPGDHITTAPGYFARALTTREATMARAGTTAIGYVARAVTTQEAER
jgi:hypothetical protein